MVSISDTYGINMTNITDVIVEGYSGAGISSVSYEMILNDRDIKGHRFSPPEKCIRLTQISTDTTSEIRLDPNNIHSLYRFILRHYTQEELE